MSHAYALVSFWFREKNPPSPPVRTLWILDWCGVGRGDGGHRVCAAGSIWEYLVAVLSKIGATPSPQLYTH